MNPTLTATQVQAIIEFSAEDLVSARTIPGTGEDEDKIGRDFFMGYGRINAYQALQLVQARRVQIRKKLGQGTPGDDNTKHLASFDSEGNFVLEGQLFLEASAGSLAATAGTDLIVRDWSKVNVARFDDVGNLFLKGTLSENACDLADAPDPGVNCNDIPALVGAPWDIVDPNQNVVAYIDQAGNLVLKGRAFIGGWDPDLDPEPGDPVPGIDTALPCPDRLSSQALGCNECDAASIWIDP